jgi:uncharacterized membrane protein
MKIRNVDYYLIAVYAAILVLLSAVNGSVWLDEALSVATARNSCCEVVDFCLHDVHPPLYFLTLKFVFTIFGESVFAAKMVSVFPAILTAIFVCLFLRKNFSKKSSILFMLCFIASTNFVLYSIELRSYSWSLFFLVMEFIAVWNIVATKKLKWYLLFLFFTLGAAFTHYYTALAAAYLYVMLLIYTILYEKKETSKVLLTGAVGILAYLPWTLAVFNTFITVTGNYWQKGWNAAEIFKYIYHTSLVGLSPDILSRIATLLNLGILFFSVWIFYKRKQRNKQDFLIYTALGCVVFVASTGIALTILVRPLFLGKYLYPTFGLVWLFFAVACNYITRKQIIYALSVIIILFGGLTFVSCLKKEKTENADYQNFCNYLEPKVSADDIFVFPDNWHYLMHIIAYKYPHHVFASETYVIGPWTNEVLWDMYHIEQINYDKLADEEKYGGKGAWIFVNESETAPDKPNPRFIAPEDEGIKFCGSFKWDFYRFKLYYAKSAADAAKYLPANLQ